MGKLALEGFWLLGGFTVVYLVGVFTAQWAKDKLNGVPASLRSALNATEASALKQMHSAKEQVVANTATLLGGKADYQRAPVAVPDPAVNPAPAVAQAAPAATT